MIKKLFLLTSFILLVISCDGNRNDSKLYSEEMDVELPAPEMANYKDSRIPSIPKPELTEQKLIKTAYLTFETPSVEKTYHSIVENVKTHNGYIQKDNTSKSYDRITRDLLIRIPNNAFQVIVDSISDKIQIFDRKDISTKDVTEEFVDLEARLKAKRKLEERYLQLLSKAKTVKDMLEIERQIAQIREEIESKQGRLKYLQNQVSYSTLYLRFYELIPVEKAPSQTYLSRLWRAVKGGFNSVGTFFIGLVYIWPYLLIAVIIGILIRKKIRKNSKRKNE